MVVQNFPAGPLRAISATPNSAAGGVIKTETIANGVVALAADQ